jgi:hypothetical protein
MKQFFLSFLLLCILLSCQSVKDTTPATATPPPAAPTTTSTPTNNPQVDSLLRLSKQYIEQQKVKEEILKTFFQRLQLRKRNLKRQ